MAGAYRLTCGVAMFALALASTGSARAQECTDDADCAEGYACDLGPMSMQDCSVPHDGACPAPQPRTGECEPRKMTCDTDADCVTGLTCKHDDGDVTCASPGSVDGGVPGQVKCGTPEPGPGECVLELVACEKDSDCDDGLECAPIARTSECSGSGPGSVCMPGQECPMPPPESETCTEVVHSYCFPPRADCDNDDDCDDGARCIVLPEDAKKDPPPGWEGADALCFPEAYALALEKRVDISGGETSEDGANSAGGDSQSGGRANDELDGADKPTGSKAGDVKVTHTDTKDDGCAVSAAGPGGSQAWLLAGVAALLLRRRRNAR